MTAAQVTTNGGSDERLSPGDQVPPSDEDESEEYDPDDQEEQRRQMVDATMERYGVVRKKISNRFVHSRKFQVMVALAVMINAVQIGAETDYGCQDCKISDRLLWFFLDNFFTSFFVIEMILKVEADAFLGYIHDNWNKLDFVLVMLAVLDTWVLGLLAEVPNLKIFTILRMLRALRLVRLVKVVKNLKELHLVIFGLYECFKMLFWVSLMACLMGYIFAILSCMLIGQEDEGVYDFSHSRFTQKEYFGTVPQSMLTMLQVLTRDNWFSYLIRPVVIRHPLKTMHLFVFLFLSNCGLLNMVVAVITERVIYAANQDETKRIAEMERKTKKEMESLRGIFEAADVDGSGELDRAEFDAALRKRHVKTMLASIEVPLADMQELFVLLDHDWEGTISVDEFMQGCLKLKGVARAKDMMQLSILVSKQITEAKVVGEKLDEMGDVMDTVVQRLTSMEKEYFRHHNVEVYDFDGDRIVPPKSRMGSAAPSSRGPSSRGLQRAPSSRGLQRAPASRGQKAPGSAPHDSLDAQAVKQSLGVNSSNTYRTQATITHLITPRNSPRAYREAANDPHMNMRKLRELPPGPVGTVVEPGGRGDARLNVPPVAPTLV